MELKNRNILITGCTGLVGSWLAESLLKENSVFGIAIDDSLNFLLESKNLINSFDITYLNIANFENLQNYFLSRKFPDFVMPIFSGMTSFFLLKIIHSEFFDFIFSKRRYSLSLIKVILLPLHPVSQLIGWSRASYLYAFFVPSISFFFLNDFWIPIFSLVGIMSYEAMEYRKKV